MPLSRDDRITFMTSTIIVDKTWMAIYRRISSADVYITSGPCLHRYIKTHPKAGEKHLCQFVTLYSDCFDNGKISDVLRALLDFRASSLCTTPIQLSMAIQHNCRWCLCALSKDITDMTLELRQLGDSVDYAIVSGALFLPPPFVTSRSRAVGLLSSQP